MEENFKTPAQCLTVLNNSIIVNYFFIISIVPEKPHRGSAIKYVSVSVRILPIVEFTSFPFLP